MKRFLLFALALGCFGAWAAIAAPVKVVTTTTDLAWLAEQIGGDDVAVTALLNGTEDPHYVDAVPRYIHLVSNADMVCIVGLDLEIGWIPKVLSKSGNAQVQPGGRGYCDASTGIEALDVVTGAVDRSMGDVHPDGNPHYHLSPVHFLQAGENVLDTLIELQPDRADAYLANFQTLSARLAELQENVRAQLEPLSGLSFMEYHKDFGYFFQVYGLSSTGALEAVPGVPPSAGRLAKTSISAKRDGVNLLVASTHSPVRVLERFSSLSDVPYIRVATSIQSTGDIESYEKLQQHIADELLRAAKPGN
jgi:zinc/manganese transport system substrate-binding protein